VRTFNLGRKPFFVAALNMISVPLYLFIVLIVCAIVAVPAWLLVTWARYYIPIHHLGGLFALSIFALRGWYGYRLAKAGGQDDVFRVKSGDSNGLLRAVERARKRGGRIVVEP